MKKTSIIASLLALGMTAAAQANSIQLGFIDTDDTNCGQAQKEVSLLNSTAAQVSAVCSDYIKGGYTSDDGQSYDYRMTTTVTIPDEIAAGTVIHLGNIVTNNPTQFQNEFQLLNSNDALVTVQVVGPGTFHGVDGKTYTYHVLTTVTAK